VLWLSVDEISLKFSIIMGLKAGKFCYLGWQHKASRRQQCNTTSNSRITIYFVSVIRMKYAL